MQLAARGDRHKRVRRVLRRVLVGRSSEVTNVKDDARFATSTDRDDTNTPGPHRTPATGDQRRKITAASVRLRATEYRRPRHEGRGGNSGHVTPVVTSTHVKIVARRPRPPQPRAPRARRMRLTPATRANATWQSQSINNRMANQWTCARVQRNPSDRDTRDARRSPPPRAHRHPRSAQHPEARRSVA